MKRVMDIGVSALLLVILAFPLLAIALLILAKDGSPAVFKQQRIGHQGRPFCILKFRTMRVSAAGDQAVTSGDTDSRITPLGMHLRRHRLDELPQLFNVLQGDMSFVGPRPEVPEYVDLESPLWQTALSVRPGITGPDALAFRDEGKALSQAENADTHYREHILPSKLAMQAKYAEQRSLAGDLMVLFRTLGVFRG